MSMQFDGSFASFINPSEGNVDDDDMQLEMIFFNEALLGVLGKENEAELTQMLNLNVFKNSDIANPLSLMSATQQRYSHSVLAKAYKYTIEAVPEQ